MTTTLVQTIADGLDASTDGRGFDAEHLRAFTLANGAQGLLDAARCALETAGEYCDGCGCHLAEEAHEDGCGRRVDLAGLRDAIAKATEGVTP